MQRREYDSHPDDHRRPPRDDRDYDRPRGPPRDDRDYDRPRGPPRDDRDYDRRNERDYDRPRGPPRDDRDYDRPRGPPRDDRDYDRRNDRDYDRPRGPPRDDRDYDRPRGPPRDDRDYDRRTDRDYDRPRGPPRDDRDYDRPRGPPRDGDRRDFGGRGSGRDFQRQDRGGFNRGGPASAGGLERFTPDETCMISQGPVDVVTNFFKVVIKKGKILRYDIMFFIPADPERDRPNAVPIETLSKGKTAALFEKLRHQHAAVLGFCAFDGSRQIYTTRELPEVLTVDITERRKIDLQFTKVSELSFNSDTIPGEFAGDLHTALELFVRKLVVDSDESGKWETKRSAMLRMADRHRFDGTDIVRIPAFVHRFLFRDAGVFFNVDYRFFFSFQGATLADCLLYYAKSLGARVNVSPPLDSEAAKAAYETGSVDRQRIDALAEIFRNSHENKRLIDVLIKGFKNFLIMPRHSSGKGKAAAPVRIHGIALRETARSKKFELRTRGAENEPGRILSVEEYFSEKYDRKLLHADVLPLVAFKMDSQGGKRRKGGESRSGRTDGGYQYLPIEVCFVLGGSYARPLAGGDRELMTRASSVPVSERLKKIFQHVNLLQTFDVDGGAVQLDIQKTPVQVQGRVLPAPTVLYNTTVQPRNGEWRLQGVPFFKPLRDDLDLLIMMPDDLERDHRRPIDTLNDVARERRMLFKRTIAEFYSKNDTHGECIVEKLRAFAARGHLNPSSTVALIVVPKRDTQRYNSVKALCDVELGLATQLITAERFRMCKAAIFANVLAAINVKAPALRADGMGENQYVDDALITSDTCFVGIDVYHSAVGQSRRSEAGFSASINAHSSQYYSTHRSQTARTEFVASINDMMYEFLEAAHGRLGVKPFSRFVIIRDGLSDSQFGMGLDELQKMRETVQSFYDALHAKDGGAGAAKPCEFVLMIAQKRNPARFAVYENNKYKNCPPGTVVDKDIVESSRAFYLVSYNALHNSPRPTYFVVLVNEANIGIQDLQRVAYKLSHLHPGCSRAVKLPMPLYNAHKIANRVGGIYTPGREDLHDDTRSESSMTSTDTADSVFGVAEQLKHTGFFL
eukprot:ANDGO_02576.mRNA.1 Protein argonaute